MSITLWHSLGGDPGSAFVQIVNEYNSIHPDQEVNVEFIDPSNYASSSRKALAGLEKESTEDAIPDIVLAPEYMTGELLQAYCKGHVVSVSTLLDEEKRHQIADIVTSTFGEHCLPLNPACGVLYINASILEKCGLDPNWKPKTLEDLIEVADKVKEAELCEFGFTCAWPEAYLVEMVLAQKNESLLTPAGHYNFSQLSNHILDIWELVQKGIFLPPNTGNYDPTRVNFIERKVVFYMQGAGHYTILNKQAAEKDFNVNCSSLPTLSLGQQNEIKHALPLGGAALWVLKRQEETTKNMIDNVRSFLNYIASKEVQKQWHINTACVPVNIQTPEDLEEFYLDHPLHQAVVEQTICAPTGENSYGIKKAGYSNVRPKLYPLIRELITLEGPKDEVAAEITNRLNAFDIECNK